MRPFLVLRGMSKIKAPELPILLIGEVCSDIHNYGDVLRISPEAPVPILEMRESTPPKKGMVNNVKLQLESLYTEGVGIDMHSSMCGHKIRYVDRASGHHLLRVDIPRSVSPFNPGQDFYEGIVKGNYSALVVADYNKGFLSDEILESLSSSASHAGIPTFIDTKRRITPSWATNFDYIKLNESEFNASFDSEVKTHNFRSILRTMGGLGSILYIQDKPEVIINTAQVNTADVSGAGDIFLAAFVYSILSGCSSMVAAKFATDLATISVTIEGCESVQWSDLENNLK